MQMANLWYRISRKLRRAIKGTMFSYGILIAVLLCGCAKKQDSAVSMKSAQPGAQNSVVTEPTQKEVSYIRAKGMTLAKRIAAPAGYTRTKAKKNSLAAFLRSYPLKKNGSPVLLYDGSKKANQTAHVAVFRLPIENEDLQQCADSVMRVYGEYYYSRKQYGKIQYSLGGGFRANFKTWSEGNGIVVDGNRVYWTRADNDTSYRSFQKFMKMVFAYSGTLNLADDSHKIKKSEIQIGDVFLKGGSPGHVVMVVDLCENADGKKAFLLAQGYMPAQEFHVLKNPLHEENPWYYADEISYPLQTPEYTFEKGSLRRLELYS